ncbi:macro domain-containing protein [Acidaminococcus massiliensis]|uniref:macro domain-containing protein n=1 Tax=Acidaminococcus massiliensis TaxID=1852375 RepID=UPI003520EF16
MLYHDPPKEGLVFLPNQAMTGVQLRYACWELMEEQGYPEPTGRAKITWGCNLPVWYVLHTVGPI